MGVRQNCTGSGFSAAEQKKPKKNTHTLGSLHLCQPVATAEGERLGGRDAQSIWESARMQMCAPADVPKRGGDRTGSRAETCRANRASASLFFPSRPPLPHQSPSLLSPSPHNPRLFLESSEMRESNYSVHCQRVSGRTSGRGGGRERGDGGRNRGR